MPRLPMDYSKSLIYTITTDDGSIYVGSTTNFTKRKYGHKTRMSNENDKLYNTKLYKAMRASSSYEIKPYKLFPCNSNLELVIEEERVRKELNANLNTNVCHSGETGVKYNKTYRETHKDEMAAYKKAYQETHKDEISEYMKAYRETHKDEIAEKGKEKHTCEICGSIYRKGHTKSNKCQKALAKTTTLQ